MTSGLSAHPKSFRINQQLLEAEDHRAAQQSSILNELPRGKLRGIKPGRFRILHLTFILICVICLPCEMRSLFLWGEICGLNIICKLNQISFSQNKLECQ
jgi:hypothetical protein